MKIEIYDSNLTKEDVRNNTMRYGCRVIVTKQKDVLVVHETKWDLTSLPGGGVEEDESYAECAIREVYEETGVVVRNLVEKVRVIEHFNGSSFTNVYFTCDLVKETDFRAFTEREIDVNLEKKWVNVFDIMDEWSTNPTKHEHGANIHNREFIGLINSL